MCRLRRFALTAATVAIVALAASPLGCAREEEPPPEVEVGEPEVEVGEPEAEVDEADSEVAADPDLAPIDVTHAVAVAVAQTAEAEYCTYRVVTAEGPDCGVFAPNALICVDCPANRTCPGTAGGRSAYRYLDADGNVRCSGEWAKRFKVDDPDACLDCPRGGEQGFELVAR
jgi:hypothetical protein